MIWKTTLLALCMLAGPGLGLLLTIAYSDQLYSVSQSLPTLTVALSLCLCGGLLVGLALLPSFVMGALCGYLLPFAWAVPAAGLAICLATSIGLLIGRAISREGVQRLLEWNPKWHQSYQALASASTSSSFALLSTLRLAPQMPFALTNLLCAHWPAPLSLVITSSVVGLLPRTYLSLAAGASAANLQTLFAERRSSGYELWLTVGVLTLVVVGVTAVLHVRRSKASQPS